MKNNYSRLVLLSLMLCIVYPSFSQEQTLLADKLVMILDVQREYTQNAMEPRESEKFINSINYVIEKTKAENLLYIKTDHKMLNLSFSSPFIYVSIDTASQWKLDERLIVLPDSHCFTKDEGDAFSSESLCAFIEASQKKEVIVIGLLAEKCVRKTLLGGMEKGYTMHVIPDAIAAKSDESKKEVLQELQLEGVSIISSDQL